MEKIINIIDNIYQFLGRYDLDIALGGGFIATLIQSVRKKMKFSDFLKLWFLASFLGYSVYKICSYYFPNLPIEIVIILISGVCGFAFLIFNELEDIFSNISEFVKTFINNKLNK